MYTNYSTFIRGAEVRIFDADESVLGTPRAVLHVDPDGIAEWRPDVRYVPATGLELKYVLRAVGDDGKFDDTNAQSLWVLREERQANPCRAQPRAPRPTIPMKGRSSSPLPTSWARRPTSSPERAGRAGADGGTSRRHDVVSAPNPTSFPLPVRECTEA